MLDLNWLLANHEKCKQLLKLRGVKADTIDKLLTLYEERKDLTKLAQSLQGAKNEKTKLLGNLIPKGNQRPGNLNQFKEIQRDSDHISEKIAEINKKLQDSIIFEELINSIPNIPSNDVPEGKDESSNLLIKTVGDIPVKNFKIKPHFEVGEELGVLDFKHTSEISGSRFASFVGPLAKLERALVNFMLDVHVKQFEFTEISPPTMVRDRAMTWVGQLPKFAAESFQTTNDYRLIPTAEVSLMGLMYNSIISEEKLPLRMVAATQCYRSEAGSAGRDTRGLIRVHQFQKVELVTITSPEESEREHEYMLNAAETILQKLGLPYRVMLLCAGDMGFSAQKTYDIEVWLPSQDKYREISSCSNCGQFQARRAKIRYSKLKPKSNEYVHSLNGSGLPIGRTIAAIMECYQNADGSISIPPVLVDYMGGITKITPELNPKIFA
ncbi:MAG: serine--tRNA ligase [Rickettsiaceae bacterium]|nr:serine--tRNA ligase [Rickettsiaceae bacterium]